MITKVQGKTVSGELSVKACPRLNALEKAMLRWAVVDPEDRVLDACVGRGLMAEYLRHPLPAARKVSVSISPSPSRSISTAAPSVSAQAASGSAVSAAAGSARRMVNRNMHSVFIVITSLLRRRRGGKSSSGRKKRGRQRGRPRGALTKWAECQSA